MGSGEKSRQIPPGAVAKNWAEWRQNVAYWHKEGRWSRAAFSRPQSQFFTVRTSQRAHNILYIKQPRDVIAYLNTNCKNKYTKYKKKRKTKICYSCPYLVEWYLDKQDNIFLWSSSVLHKTVVGKQSRCIPVCDQFHNNKRYTHLFATVQPLCNTFLLLCRNICWLTSQLNKE